MTTTRRRPGTPARLTLYAGLLAISFLIALGAGRVIDVNPPATSSDAPAHTTTTHGAHDE